MANSTASAANIETMARVALTMPRMAQLEFIVRQENLDDRLLLLDCIEQSRDNYWVKATKVKAAIAKIGGFGK